MKNMLLFCRGIPVASENYFIMHQNLHLQTVVFIGSGNVAGHLAKAMADAGLTIVQVFSPHIVHARKLASGIGAVAENNYSQIVTDADLYLISVPDGKIATVVAEMPQVNGIVCHTSGITSLNVLEKFSYSGVFYPFQTFSKNSPVDISKVPFCIEASSPDVLERLQLLAGKMSKSVYAMDDAQRKKLHLAGVLVNNFTNHLYASAEDFLEANGMDVALLLPLIKETATKIQKLPPDVVQTGPARRGDMSTIEKHLEMLKDREDLKEIYHIFSQQILKKYHE
jgi:predicted short-subunit dehydrogenase-like oxidoreductase (DUF2520 family)